MRLKLLVWSGILGGPFVVWSVLNEPSILIIIMTIASVVLLITAGVMTIEGVD